MQKTNREKFNQDAIDMYQYKTLGPSSNTEIQTKLVYKRAQPTAIKVSIGSMKRQTVQETTATSSVNKPFANCKRQSNRNLFSVALFFGKLITEHKG